MVSANFALVVKDKHDTMAALKSSEDKIEAMEAELEYLKVQIKVSGNSRSQEQDNSFIDLDSGTV